MTDPASNDPGGREPTQPDVEAMIAKLMSAPIEVVGQFTDASNATLLVRLLVAGQPPLEELADRLGREPTLDDLDPADLAVYKPRAGEAPLVDFPDGTLHLRETAAYEVSQALGWDLVPVTVVRDDAPFGRGSLQRFVPHDPDRHYVRLLEEGDAAVVAQLQAMVVFDLVIDNADRKAGHVLWDTDAQRLQLVDHGVSFNVEPKLRTVAWDFAGDPIPQRLRDDVATFAARLDADLADRFTPLLSEDELGRLAARARVAAQQDAFPAPAGRWSYPWPLW